MALPLVFCADSAEPSSLIRRLVWLLLLSATRCVRRSSTSTSLAPPRTLDPTATIVWIAPQEVTEVEQQTCKLSSGLTTEEREATAFLFARVLRCSSQGGALTSIALATSGLASTYRRSVAVKEVSYRLARSFRPSTVGGTSRASRGEIVAPGAPPRYLVTA